LSHTYVAEGRNENRPGLEKTNVPTGSAQATPGNKRSGTTPTASQGDGAKKHLSLKWDEKVHEAGGRGCKRRGALCFFQKERRGFFNFRSLRGWVRNLRQKGRLKCGPGFKQLCCHPLTETKERSKWSVERQAGCYFKVVELGNGRGGKVRPKKKTPGGAEGKVGRLSHFALWPLGCWGGKIWLRW